MLGTIWQIMRRKPLAGLHLYRLERADGTTKAVVTSEGDRIPVADYLAHLHSQHYPKRIARAKLEALPVLHIPRGDPKP